MSYHKSGENVIKLNSDQEKKMSECQLQIMATGKRYTRARSQPLNMRNTLPHKMYLHNDKNHCTTYQSGHHYNHHL